MKAYVRLTIVEVKNEWSSTSTLPYAITLSLYRTQNANTSGIRPISQVMGSNTFFNTGYREEIISVFAQFIQVYPGIVL